MSEPTIIYVSVLMSGSSNKFWHPIKAIHQHKNCYRIIETSCDPEHEYWQFAFDEIVACKTNKFAEGEYGLIAFEKCEHQ